MNRELAETYISYAIDSELPDRQRADLEAWLAAHPEDRELAEQWKAIGQLTRADAAALPIPDVEVAWMDIRRAIRKAEPEPAPAVPWFFRWRLALAGASVAAIYLSVLTFGLMRGGKPPAVAAAENRTQVEWAETDVPGATMMVFQDEESGLAVVWMMTDEPADDAKKNSG